MTLTLTPVSMFIMFTLITSIGQTFFASLLLILSKHENRGANIILSCFMISLCSFLTILFLLDFWRAQAPHATLLYQPIGFVLPPLLFLYIRKLSSPGFQISLQSVIIHLTPAIVATMLMAPFFQLSGIEKLEFHFFKNDNYILMSDVQNWTKSLITPIKIASIMQGFIYVYLCWKTLNIHQSNIENQFSNTEHISLSWLRYLVISCGVIYAFTLVSYGFNIFGKNAFILWIINVTTGCSLLSIFGYFGVRQKGIYIEKNNDNIDIDEPIEISFTGKGVTQKYKSSTLSKSHLDEIYKELLDYMEGNKPYLNPELSLRQLAEELHIPHRDLSRVINEVGGKNFLEFVNAYRIDLAKRELAKSRDATVLHVAMNAGFNSKSAFYEAFKRATSVTPTQFRKQITSEEMV